MIRVECLTKEYNRYIQKEGFLSGVKNLFNRKYEIKKAVNNISFEINEGELVGYIGPNGAGKSTSIKILTGILAPTAGCVKVNGIDPYKERKANARQIGVVFGQKTQLWWDVPVIESLRLLRDIYNISEKQFKKNLDIFSDLLELHQFQQQPVRQLSLGQRMRADLAAALIHNPRLLFLDEPTIGVDIVTKEKLRSFIREINREQKVTVMLTTHDMSDIEKLCSRMMIVDHGQIIYDGGLEQIRFEYGKYRTLVVQFETNIPDFEVPFTELIKTEGNKKWYRFNRYETSPSELITFIGDKSQIIDLMVEEPEIEEMVRNIYLGR